MCDYKVTIESIPPVILKQEETLSADDIREKTFEYQLKVEELANKFFEMKHKITFFLVTAAVGSIAYTLNFSVNNLPAITAFIERESCLIFGSLSALLTVAFALMSMNYDMHSNRLNLVAYFDRKQYEELTPAKKAEWTATSQKAALFEVLAFTFLCISVAYQAALFVLLII